MLEIDLVPTPLEGANGEGWVDVRAPYPRRRFRGLFLLGRAGAFLLWLARRRLRGRPPAVEIAVALRGLFESLGGLWIKLGQLVAMRRDLLPSDFCSELGRLHDRAAGFPGELSRRIVEEDLGRPLESVFDQFEERPFAAASIGQVHRARLRGTGFRVAVKVQRPHVRPMVERDLRFVRRVCHGLHFLDIHRNFQWHDLVRELTEAMREELDYRLEASSIARMRRTLRRHGIYVPRVFGRFCASRVLTMEFVHGVLVSDFLAFRETDPQGAQRWLAVNEIRPTRVGRRLHLSLMRQIFEDNVFHGDLHPGNIMLLRRSHVALIDFGSVGSLEARFREFYRRLLRGLSDVDFEKTADMMSLLAPAPVGDVDWDRLRRNATGALRQAELRAWAPNLSYAERSVTRVLLDVARSLAAFNVSVGWAFMRVDRAHVTLDASLMHLVPDISYFALAQRYFAEANKRSFGPALRAKLANGLRPARAMAAGSELAERLDLVRGSMHEEAFVHRSRGPAQSLVEFAAGMLGRVLLAAAAVTAAVLGARHLPAPIAGPLARALPSLTAAAPDLQWTLGMAVVLALVTAAVRLMRVERSLTGRDREKTEPGAEVA